ncbi:MAG: lipopolysaccharide assembly protein LapA domain-containing protein [Crocinitomicaceae bacterium]|jgi:uncharacterized integral membrane protein|nr:lipopolysaccharide assembly protein LapA domain-containing protein [Crocinitomicaceae bacterium]
MKEYWQDLSNWQKFSLVFKLICIVLGILFIVQNWQKTEVSLVFAKVELPVMVLMLISGILGYMLATFFSFKKLRAKDKELKNLRENKKDDKNLES